MQRIYSSFATMFASMLAKIQFFIAILILLCTANDPHNLLGLCGCVGTHKLDIECTHVYSKCVCYNNPYTCS
jgi:hypothetical protein